MTKVIISAVALVMLVCASAVQAATLTNRDSMPHKLVVIENDSEQEVEVQAGQRIDDICSNSCAILIGNDPDPYDITKNDRVEILDGELFYEEEVATENPPR